MKPVLSVIDFAFTYPGERPRDAFHRSVKLAQHAEKLGFHRVWYTEHHNLPNVVSSSPAVLIAYVGAHTSTIRLGAGGVMLPNHAPLIVAEQFGSLEEMYPGRIDLGLGRAPGTDVKTLYALRRTEHSAENFPADISELQGYLGSTSRISGVHAYPGKNTNVPLYILGSSLFGARLAAQLGLPYSFASHFAPQLMHSAIATYREEFQPSEQLSDPYVIAAVNVTAGETSEDAHAEFEKVKKARVKAHLRGTEVSEEDWPIILESDGAQRIMDQLRYTAVGTAREVTEYLENFAKDAQADELMVCIQATEHEHAMKSMDILGSAWFEGK